MNRDRTVSNWLTSSASSKFMRPVGTRLDRLDSMLQALAGRTGNESSMAGGRQAALAGTAPLLLLLLLLLPTPSGLQWCQFGLLTSRGPPTTPTSVSKVAASVHGAPWEIARAVSWAAQVPAEVEAGPKL